jgi:ArsR family transcriptional regulator, arsenate/arsenite/antimonite-responsive transcriptional repressor
MGKMATKNQTDSGAWTERASLLRAIAHPVRLMILEALCEGPLCVTDLNGLVAIPQPQVSQHMAALRKSGVVACHVNGPLRCYYITKPTLVKKLVQLLTADHPVRERDRSAVVRDAERRRKQSQLPI